MLKSIRILEKTKSPEKKEKKEENADKKGRVILAL